MPWLQIGRPRAVSMSEKVHQHKGYDHHWHISEGGSIKPPCNNGTAIDIAGLYEYDDYHVIGTNDYGNGGNGGGCGYDQHA